ncbi:MAG: hypothetical protein IJ458_04940 [Clostridia bacterium]|nr:hypothetical protein [Clostridia bacterium]
MGLMKDNFKQFLADNGYIWSGYIAEHYGRNYEQFKICDKFALAGLNNKYILLGSRYDYDEDDGYIKVTDDPVVKYIKHTDIMFRVYTINKSGNFELEKDLSAEWVRYQALNVKDYIKDTLPYTRHIQVSYPKRIQERKNLLAQEIELLTKSTNDTIREMEDTIFLSKMVEDVLGKVQQERLIKQQIGLGAKDDFKDTTSNDACLQHLTDTFGSRK